MTGLKYLSLEGNLIETIPDEAFQNLHHLSTLNLAYNNMKILNFNAFDSIGTLSHLFIGNIAKMFYGFKILFSILYEYTVVNNVIIYNLLNFSPDISHNKLSMLRLNRTGKGSQNNNTLTYNGMGIGSNSRSSHNYPTSSNIVSLNLAYNNISMIEQSFFQTVETVLKVSKNHLISNIYVK